LSSKKKKKNGGLQYLTNGSVWMDVWITSLTMAFADGCFDYGLTKDLCEWMLGLQCSKWLYTDRCLDHFANKALHGWILGARLPTHKHNPSGTIWVNGLTTSLMK
jgi:hypothetical protein